VTGAFDPIPIESRVRGSGSDSTISKDLFDRDGPQVRPCPTDQFGAESISAIVPRSYIRALRMLRALAQVGRQKPQTAGAYSFVSYEYIDDGTAHSLRSR
jgi:hypothetical protein